MIINLQLKRNSNSMTTKSLSLRQNFSWTFLGNVVYAACQWGMLMSMAKVGTAHMVGEFSLGLAVTAPIFMFTNLQLSGVLATDAKSSQPFESYLGLRICTTIIALAVILVFVLFGHYQFETALIIILVGIAKGSESISDVIFGLLQKHERMDQIATSLMIKGIISLITLCILIRTTGNVILSILGFATSWIIVLLIYDFPNARRYSKIIPIYHFAKIWPLIRTSLPLGFVMMLVSLNTNIPRYFIEHYLGTESVGYFAALSYIMIAGNTVVSALGQSASPRLARYYADFNLKAFKSLLLKLIIIGCCLGLLGWIISLIFSKEILTLLYKPIYANYTRLFVLIMFGAGISYVASFFGYGMTAARKFSVQPLLFGVVTAINAIANLILVPLKGLEGAAYALIITYICQLLGAVLINEYIFKRDKRSFEGGKDHAER